MGRDNLYKVDECNILSNVGIMMDIKIKETLNNFLSNISNTLKLINGELSQSSSDELLAEFFKEVRDFAIFLNELYGFEKEYDYYLSIIKMLRYTLKNYDFIDKNDSKLVFESLMKFNDLIKFKVFFLSGNISEEEYLNKFEDFVNYLRKLKDYFYLNIYHPIGSCEETIHKISEIVWGDEWW